MPGGFAFEGGHANRVIFDAGKNEETIVISTTDGIGGPAKVLGIALDNKLIMSTASHKCATSAALKTKLFFVHAGVT